MGSKLMISVKMPNKDEPLLKEDTPEPSKQTKGSSLKQVFILNFLFLLLLLLNLLNHNSSAKFKNPNYELYVQDFSFYLSLTNHLPLFNKSIVTIIRKKI